MIHFIDFFDLSIGFLYVFGQFKPFDRGLEEALGQKVVGVSVCWDFQEYEDDLLAPRTGMGLVGNLGNLTSMSLWLIYGHGSKPMMPYLGG